MGIGGQTLTQFLAWISTLPISILFTSRVLKGSFTLPHPFLSLKISFYTLTKFIYLSFLLIKTKLIHYFNSLLLVLFLQFL